MSADPLLALNRALTEEDRALFLGWVHRRWPRLRGAQVADVLEHTTSCDMFLEQTGPFYEDCPDDAGCLCATEGATAALHVLIILGRDLTTANVTGLLTRASLIPGKEAKH